MNQTKTRLPETRLIEVQWERYFRNLELSPLHLPHGVTVAGVRFPVRFHLRSWNSLISVIPDTKLSVDQIRLEAMVLSALFPHRDVLVVCGPPEERKFQIWMYSSDYDLALPLTAIESRERRLSFAQNWVIGGLFERKTNSVSKWHLLSDERIAWSPADRVSRILCECELPNCVQCNEIVPCIPLDGMTVHARGAAVLPNFPR